jgi:membrane protein YdbS with pleckstrin-like domain
MTQPVSDIPDPQAAPADRPHKPAGDTEEVYFEGSPLLRGELAKGFLWLLAGGLLVIVPILIRVYHDDWPPALFSLAMVVIGLILLFVPWIRAKSHRFRITNYRIDFQRGLLSRNIDTLELWHVEDLRFHQSLLARILGVGQITIISKHPTTPVLVIPSIPKAQFLFKTLEQRVIAVKRQSGVIKVDTGDSRPT